MVLKDPVSLNMHTRCVLKYSLVGLGLQILFIVICALVGISELASTIYWPWILLGNMGSPSGAAGHALPGGAILGFLVGIAVYSLLIGAALCYLRQERVT